MRLPDVAPGKRNASVTRLGPVIPRASLLLACSINDCVGRRHFHFGRLGEIRIVGPSRISSFGWQHAHLFPQPAYQGRMVGASTVALVSARSIDLYRRAF